MAEDDNDEDSRRCPGRISGGPRSDRDISHETCLLAGEGSLVVVDTTEGATAPALALVVLEALLFLLPLSSLWLVSGDGSGATGDAPDLVEALEVGLRC